MHVAVLLDILICFAFAHLHHTTLAFPASISIRGLLLILALTA